MTLPRLAPRLLALCAVLMFAAPAMAQPKSRAKLSTALNTTALQPGKPAVLAIVVDVDPGHHAQSRTPLTDNLIRFDVKLDANPAITVGEPIYPPGEIHDYGQPLGKLSVYEGKVVVYVPITVKPDAKPAALTLTGRVVYQICDDKVCFAPERPKFEIETKVVAADEAVQPNQAELFANYKATAASGTTATSPSVTTTLPPVATPPTTAPAAESEAAIMFGEDDKKWSTPFAFTMAMLAGLVFNVMPCVLPVLPLKAIGFYEVSQHRRGQSFMLGIVFSLGMISVFALLGVLVLGLQWLSWGEMFSKPWFVWPLAIFLLLMAASLFGAFNVNLPTGVYSFAPRHDTYSGNYFWGALTAIMATPCTAPLLPSLLIWAAAQPATIGVISMILVGVGMALPYLLLSAMPEVARKLPRSGPWPELFKQMMGFAMLAVGVYFIAGRIIDGSAFWWPVVLVLAIACVYLVARTAQLSPNARPMGISSTIAVVTLALSIGWAAQVNGMLMRPTGGGGGASGGSVAGFTPYSDAAFAKARASGKPVLVKFTANWCLTCQVIEGTVFQNPEVWSALREQQVVPLKVDLTDEDAPGNDLLLKLNPSGGIPLTAIYMPGKAQPLVLASVYSSRDLLAALNQAATTAQASTR